MNAMMNFASKNATVANTIAKLFALKPLDPKNFRLSVPACDDVVPEGVGQYNLEAPILCNLIDTVYAEVVVAATTTERRDSIPVAERGRSLSEYDSEYDGAEEPEATEDDLKDRLQSAIDRASVVLRYARHIASIKDGGASWITGFDVDKYIAVDPEDEEAENACRRNGDVSRMIIDGRVKRVSERIRNRLVSFNEWCKEQLLNENISVEWKAKVAMARVQDIDVPDCPVNTAVEYIADLVAGCAFNRSTSRLEDAVVRVANTRYIKLAYALQDGAKRPIEQALKSFDILPYSKMLQHDIAEVMASDEWADHQLALDVAQAKKDAEAELRAAIRAQTMSALEKQAKEVAAIKAQAAGIYAMINAEKATVTKAEKAAKAETKPKAKAKAEAKAAVAKAKTKGIAGTKSAFDHLK